MEEIIKAYQNVPYFNNKSRGRRAGLAVEVGKGSAKEIMEEVEAQARKEKVDLRTIDLKKFMVDHDIGIDCSGFAYYLLDSHDKGSLKQHLTFTHSPNFISRFFAKLKPVKNVDVLVFADARNSKLITLDKIKVGDMITMVNTTERGIRNHILVVRKVEYPVIYYVHAVAWPTDGEYGHGVHEGQIEILDPGKPIVEQRWIEQEKEGEENYTHMRAKKSVTEVRRLNWFD
jgi:hypothetical protein